MTWNDRVIRTTEGEEASVAIDEVDDDNGRPKEPAHPAGETLEEPADDLQAHQAAR
jgi:hypothetical protein